MHRIDIPQSFVDGVIARRGRLDRFPRLDARRTALVVIDLQNGFMLPGMPVAVPTALEIVPNVNRLARAIRAGGGQVVWVQMSSAENYGGWTVFGQGFSDEFRARVAESLRPGSHGYALHADLGALPEDLRIDKTRFSAFIQGSSDLDARLRERGIDTVVVTGTVTNICCESTARDAMMLDYKVVFPSDANAAVTDDEHNATLRNMIRTFADVCTTDEAIARFGGIGELAAAE